MAQNRSSVTIARSRFVNKNSNNLIKTGQAVKKGVAPQNGNGEKNVKSNVMAKKWL